MKKSVKLTALFCAAALLASSMLSPMSAAVQAKAKKPALSKKKITITLGKTAKLKVKRAKGCKITWKSKKKKVVTVKKSGKYAAKLKAKKKGTAKVIATVKKGRKKYKLTCKVKVVLIKDDTFGIASNSPNVSTDASVTPTMPTQGKTDIPSSAPSVSPFGSPSDVPTATPTETSDVPASTTPTATGDVTAPPSQKPTATPTPEPTPTATPTEVPTPTPKTGDLVITKTVQGPVAAEEAVEAISFEVVNSVTGEIKELKLKDFDYSESENLYTYTLKNVGAGKYTVKETIKDVAGFVLASVEYSVDGAAAIAGKEISVNVLPKTETIVAYENTYEPEMGNLILTKTLRGPILKEDAEKSISFEITNTETGEKIIKSLEDFSYSEEDQQYVLYIRDVVGTYKVKEIVTDVDGLELVRAEYTVNSSDATEGENASASIEKDQSTVIGYVNEYGSTAAATPTATGDVTATPTQKPTATPTQKPTATPTQKPTATPTQKPTATPSQKPTAAPSQKPTATATAKPTVTATVKPTAIATQQPTPTSGSTPAPTSVVTPKPDNYSMTLSADTFLGSGATEGKTVYNADGSVTVTLTNQYGGGGIAFYFNELKSKVDVSGYTKAVFNLSADEQAPICISAYRSTDYWDDSDDGKAIALSYSTVTTEKKDFNCELTKCNEVLGFGVKYNTYGKEPDEIPEKFNLTIHSITFVKDTPTPSPSLTPTPTPVPIVTPAPEQETLTLSKDTLLLTSSVVGSPVYNEDGSVTLTIKNEYGGGGIAFCINNSTTPVDLSNYNKVIYTLSSETGESFQINAYRSTDFWESAEGKTSINLNTVKTTAEKQDYSCELTGLDSALGFGVRFCGWATEAKEVTLTIHSISLVKDERNIEDSITNYTSLAELAASYGLKMGTVMNAQNVKDKKYTDLMKYHFNSITAANEMKAYSILNESASKEAAAGDLNAMPALRFDGADAIMDFAQENGIKVRGHVLVWDAGMNDWFFREGYDTSKKYASTEVVKARLKYYIEQVLIHFEQKYPGVIYCWDVVNEAVGDSSSEYVEGDKRHVRTKRGDATNLFYDTIGEDYVELSFLYTYEAIQNLKGIYPALEDLKLYYNDYSTFQPSKRDAICELVKSINSYKEDESGKYIKLCDGVGMQSYIGGWGDDPQPGCMSEGDIALIKTAILKYASLGVEVQATELAVRNFLADEETAKKHGEYYKKLFQMYLDLNSGTEKPLKAISIWGIVDNPDLKKGDYSYSMNGPYCGLFDDKLAVKPAFVNIHDLMKNGQ